MSMPRVRPFVLGVACLVATAAETPGQGIVVDRRSDRPIAGSFDVESVVVDALVREQVARVRVSQTLSNPTEGVIEAEYLFPVPDAGSIRDFVLLVDGRELVGELMNADEARRIYEEIVRRKRDPALLEYMGRGLIRTSVFPIPPRAERTVTMTYTQLLPRDRNVVEFSYPFGTQKFTSKPIRTLELSMRVESRVPIKSIYSPSHDVSTELESDHEARVSYDAHDVIPAADLRVFYTVDRGGLGASVLSYRPDGGEDGYFLLLASPSPGHDDRDREPSAKTVVFAIDRSGSMSGEKIDQAKDALDFVLNNLRPDDTFNIVAYDDRVETYKPELQRYDPETRRDALAFVEGIRPGGSTNIDAALRTSLEMLHDDGRPRYVIFLTDGLPTAGETDELRIAEHARQANDSGARVFPFGVGFDVNARLLDRLGADHGGTTDYVKPDEDIEASVSRFYSKLTSPVLADLRVELSGTSVNHAYPRDLPDLFEGGQISWVGRYTGSGRTAVRISGMVGDERRTFEFEADLARPGENARYDFVEPLWASRRIGDIIDQIDLHGKNPELTEELVRLSTRYGILTPYTSFLADEGTQLHAFDQNNRRAGEQLSRLEQVQGAAGVGQRSNKAFYKQAERAIIADSLSIAPGLDPQGQPQSPEGRAGQLGRFRGGIGGFGGLGGGFGGMGGMGGMAGPARGFGLGGTLAEARDFEGNSVPVSTVRKVGPKTFFYRDGRWLDSTVTPEQESGAERVVQFTDPYFALARSQPSAANQYLAFRQPVVVKLGETVYRIEPAPKDTGPRP
ncbi:VIT domain-containing protein [Tautonia plasticadhaerens]|uniref:von Willebrand factor type A domain protein n=1 Tax=Tautonia plasticadhaerens TaxID=2527974 RepID=A0A518H8Q9_9BACT|nr:VIT domain-containing protein [Tautonia plasticadhaerens]QDV37211.1 von Willebrand factor type A domain protein [Tautonia plasticadhaerens]